MTPQIPQTDSIKELADFWQSHDLTDLDAELEEVIEPVFVPQTSVLEVPLTSEQVTALRRLAELRGVNAAALVQEWVSHNLQPIQ